MSLEATLSSWTGPSSPTEQEKQDRAERMVREAIAAHEPFKGYDFKVYAKGSYANNTNVRSDSDVDIAVQCREVQYWEATQADAQPELKPYQGPWTPSELRKQLTDALAAKFKDQVDDSGSTAIRVNASTARVEADVVPCFDYREYFSKTNWRDGAVVFKKNSTTQIHNYADQQLKNGRAKNNATNGSFKKAVRIMKRVENAMVAAKVHREVPSYFVECLVYNVPNSILLRSTWESTIKGVIGHIWTELDGDEPSDESGRWLEVNGIKFLFWHLQPWKRKDARDFALAAWNYLELGA